MISRVVIDDIKAQLDIVSVIESYIPLNQRGSRHWALCPFHKETHPSFCVKPKEQYFYCFGCKQGGDVIRFIELYKGKSFKEALIELAQLAGVSIPHMTPDEERRHRERREIEDVLFAAALFYHQNLTEQVRAYLIRRGFTEETITRFLIGYAQGGLRKHLLEERKFPLDLCLKAGVLKREGEGVRDYFYGRVIFPNLRHGRVVHMTGRSLDEREPKYLHLPGPIEHLYNEDALKEEVVIVTEGIFDCLSAVQAGYPAVALLGSTLKPELLPRFARTRTVYLCLDGDRAGEEGALEIGKLIGERSRIVQLPWGLDLNDYLREHSQEDFEALIADAKDVIEYELGLIPPDTVKTELPERLDPILEKLAQMDKAKAEAYLSYKIKPRFSLTRDDIAAYREVIKEYRRGAPTLSAPKPVHTAIFDGLVDLVEGDEGPAFLIKDGEELSIRYQVELKGVIYVPPPREKIPWLLPRGEEVMKYYHLDGDGELYKALLAHHQAISELPGEEYYDLIVAWDFHTYLAERFQYSPIICLYAVPERGKTRTGKGMIYVAYRGIHVESLRDAYLVRVANDLGVSIFFDVKDIWQKAEKNGSEDILLHRFEKGATVPRVLFPDRGAHQDMVYYSVFGPTVISTNEGVHHILETRAIQINMPETSKRFENDVTPALCLPYKERLVAFRARHLGEELPEIHKPAGGRLGDILKPLHQIILLVRPEREGAFLRLVRQIEEERLTEKADSLEAHILAVVARLGDQVERRLLPVKKITDAFNEGRPEKAQVTYQRIGRRLSAMGFKKDRGGDGAFAIVWDEELLNKLKQKYGLAPGPQGVRLRG